MLVRWVVLVVFCGGVRGYPLEGGLSGSSRHVLTDPVYSVEFGGAGGSGAGALVREKREEVLEGLGDDGRKGVWMRRRRRGSSVGGGEDSQYKSVKGLDYKHPFRRKVRPVEKPITPYFVRILRRKPVGPSAMNYTVGGDAFESSDNGEIIDVPKVLVDKRRNKNVDIHPIYVVEDEEAEGTNVSGERDFRDDVGRNESLVFVPTSSNPKGVTEASVFEGSTGALRVSEVVPQTRMRGTEKPVGVGGRVPIVRFTRVGMEEEKRRGDEVTSVPEVTTDVTSLPEVKEEVDYYKDYKGKGDEERVDYLPLDYEYEKEGNGSVSEGNGSVSEGKEGGEVGGEDRGSDQLEVISGGGGELVVEPLRLISVRGEGSTTDDARLTTTPQPRSAHHSGKSLFDDEHAVDVAPSKKRVLSQDEGPAHVVDGDLRSSDSGVYGDYGYGGVVIGREEESSTGGVTYVTTTSTVPTTTTSTTTTTPAPTTTTPTTTTTTTTTTTAPPPTTTTTTTTTTTEPPTTTTTTTTPRPTTTEPPTTTTPIPTTTQPRSTTPHLSEEQLLTEILNSLPEDDSPSSFTPQDATTLQQLLLAHLLTSTQSTPLQTDQFAQYTQPQAQYTSPPDLQTSASSTTSLFSTRADVDQQLRTTTTRNPLLLLFDNLTGNSNNQQRSAPVVVPTQQGQVVSIVRPIQESKVGEDGGGGGGVNIMRMLIQLPGNILVGLLRFMRGAGEMLGEVMNGVMKFVQGIANGGGGGGGGLFGG